MLIESAYIKKVEVPDVVMSRIISAIKEGMVKGQFTSEELDVVVDWSIRLEVRRKNG